MVPRPVVIVSWALLVAGCPHDFTRGPTDVGANDNGSDVPVADQAASDAKGETPPPPDLIPPSDTRCWPPCVETLPHAFNAPWGVAVDSADNLYVSESNGHRIRIISQGTMKDLVPISPAQFKGPAGITVDGAGTVYVADSNNHRVRKIENGQVETLAGGAQGFKDGLAADAKFNPPEDVAVGSGEIYVADQLNNRIRAIANGSVTTLAGDGVAGVSNGPIATARFYYPRGVVTHAGKLYVADSWNHCIRLIENNVVSTFAGQCGKAGLKDGQNTAALFRNMVGITVDAGGKVYVADTQNFVIRVITKSTSGTINVETLAGDGSQGYRDGPASTAEFNTPTGVAVDSAGRVYVADKVNDRVRVIYP